MTHLHAINITLTLAFGLCMAYQFFYLFISLTKKQHKIKSTTNHRYAVIVAARNESNVINQLIESVKSQDYPAALIDIFVVADNCTDATAQVARTAGAMVYERFNTLKVGKGYALDFLFTQIKQYHAQQYDAYLVFDADNLLTPNYITEMNHVFDQGYNIITSYRNSKNYADSWISSGYSLWFLKESRYLNHPRMMLHSSCAISGTGFLVSAKTIDTLGGWKFFTLTEDIEFTFNRVAAGDAIGYAHDAIFFDEQPTTLALSIKQRSRWIKGAFQVLKRYAAPLTIKFFKTGNSSCFDMIMNTVPMIILGCIGLVCNLATLLVAIVTGLPLSTICITFLGFFANWYLSLLALGALIVTTEWHRINATKLQLLQSILTFPFFAGSYLIAFGVAVCTNVTWAPIPHHACRTTKNTSNRYVRRIF